MFKKIISSTVALLICLSTISFPVFARENDVELLGAYVHVNKTYQGNGYTLTITGSYEVVNNYATNIDVKASGVAGGCAVVITSCNAYQNGRGIKVVVSYYVGSISDSYTHTFYA